MARSGLTQAALAQAGLIAAATALTTPLYGGFFAGWGFLPCLIAACVLASALAVVLAARARPAWSSVLACVAGFGVAALFLVLGGTLHDGIPTSRTWSAGWRALTGGWAAMLSIAAPAPDSPQMLMTPTLATWLAGFLAVTVALRTRSVLGPAAILVCAEAAGLVSASNQPTTHLALTCAFVLFLLAVTMMRSGEQSSQRPDSPVHGRRRAVVFTAALTGVGLAAAVATIPLDAVQRYNPRDLLAPRLHLTQAGNALSVMREQLRSATPRVLFTVTITAPGGVDTADPAPLMQAVALEDFDGSQWSSSDTFRVAGPVLAAAPAGSDAVALTEHVALGALAGPYLPVAGRATRIDADLGSNALIGFDPGSGTLVTDADSFGGGSYTVTAEEPPAAAVASTSLADAAAGSGADFAPYVQLPPAPDALTALAFQVTAAAVTPYGKLVDLADYLKNLPVNLNAPAGDSYGSVIRLLTADSPQGKAGYADQHASAFAIMARIEHIPTRVAVGYRLPAPSATQGTSRIYTVTTADSYAWDQAYLQGYGWIDFDPTDTGDVVGLPPASTVPAPPPAQPSALTSATPSAAPQTGPLSQSTQPVPIPVAGPVPASRPGSFPIRIVIPGLALLACLGLAGVTAARRTLRRRRRRRADKPAVQVVGAWREALDRLADAGVAIRASETPTDLAARASRAGQVARNRRTREERALALAAPYLNELAVTVTAAAFRAEEPGRPDVERAWRLERQISRALYRGRRAPYRVAHWTVPASRHHETGRRR